EKLWEATQTLAYGGSGISYFTYWTPPNTGENFGQPIVDNGVQTPQYAQAKYVNARVAAYGKYLVAAKSIGVFQNGPLPGGTVPRVPGASVYFASSAPITVGLFSTVNDDQYAFLANHDYHNVTEADVFVMSAGTPEQLDLATGAFVPLTVLATDPVKGMKVHVKLDAADGALIHLIGPVPAGAPGAEAFVGTVRADQGQLDIVDSSFGDGLQRPAGWYECPEGYPIGGHDLQSNGMWICPRKDLASHTFYLGNVVADQATLYSVTGGVATSMGPSSWDTCPKGKEIGRRFESNGFWLCMD
ncbi:MAG: hypothetical protein ABI551_02410, partial [Polyangiaceae bacterium]